MKESRITYGIILVVFLGALICGGHCAAQEFAPGLTIRYGFDDVGGDLHFRAYSTYPGPVLGPYVKIAGGVIIWDGKKNPGAPPHIQTTTPPNIYGTSDGLLPLGDGSFVPGDPSIFTEDGKAIPGDGSVRSGEISGKFFLPAIFLKLDVLHGFGRVNTFTLTAYDADLKEVGRNSCNLDASHIDPWDLVAAIGSVAIRAPLGEIIRYFQINSDQEIGSITYGIDSLEYTLIPVPPSFLLMVSGLLGLGLFGIKWRRD